MMRLGWCCSSLFGDLLMVICGVVGMFLFFISFVWCVFGIDLSIMFSVFIVVLMFVLSCGMEVCICVSVFFVCLI